MKLSKMTSTFCLFYRNSSVPIILLISFLMNPVLGEIDESFTEKSSHFQKGACSSIGNSISFIDRWKKLYEQGKNIPINKNVEHINQTHEVLQTLWKNMEYLLIDSNSGRDMKKAFELFSQIDLGASKECLSSLFQIFDGVVRKEMWALKFFDSTGRLFPPGYLEGIQSDFGDYDECLDIESPLSAKKLSIKGQYCLMNIILPVPSIGSYDESETAVDLEILTKIPKHYGHTKYSTMRSSILGLNMAGGTIFRLGICIPSQCSAQEYQNLVNKVLFPITRIPIEVNPRCHVKNVTKQLDYFQIISITFLLLLISLMILSTCFEIYINAINSKCDIVNENDNLLTSFSILRNTRSLFNKNENFQALDTFRLLLILNTHLFHSFIIVILAGSIGLKKFYSEALLKPYESKYILMRNSLMLDALFTLSGLLLSFGILRQLDKTKGRFNYFEFMFQRWIRFIFLIFGSTLFYFLYPLTGDGPIWDMGIDYITSPCYNPYELLKMLFLTNNVSGLPACNVPTWFLSALFHLSVFSLILVVTYKKKKGLAMFVLISAIFLSTFASIAPKILFNIRPYIVVSEIEMEDIMKAFYWYHFSTHNYGIGFFVGIGFGYFLQKKIQISRSKSAIFWNLSIILCSLIYFWNNSFWKSDLKSVPLTSFLIWFSFGKLIFCTGIGWILFACCSGRGGFLNKVLSWQVFVPLARLSTGIYLLHHLVVVHRIYSIRYTYVFSDKYLLEYFIVDLVYDIILAYVFYVLIESPFSNVLVYFKRKTFNHMKKTN